MIRFTLLTFFLLALASPSAHAQADLDTLWSDYGSLSDALADGLERVDSANPATSTGDRVYRQTADTASELAGVIETLLTLDTSIGGEDRAALIDSLLTTRQIAGSLYVDVGECEVARAELAAVLEHPLIGDRPLIRDRSAVWAERADACIAEQELAAAAEIEAAIEAEREAARRAEEEAAAQAAAEREADGEGGGNRALVGATLAAGGGALIAGALAWDAALGSSRSELQDLQEVCRTTPDCGGETARANELSDKITGARVPMAIMLGVGTGAAVTGVVLLIKGDGDDRVAIAPSFAPGFAGADVRLRF